MAETENKQENKTDDTITKVAKLQDRIYKACGKLDENAANIGEPMYNEMLEHYRTQYLREFARMNESELIDVDKEIERLKIRRAQELWEIKQEEVKINAEIEELRANQEREFEFKKKKLAKEFEIACEKELGEMQLEHDRVKAEIERKRAKLATDLEIWEKTVEQELSAKMARVVPGYKLRRRFLGIPIGRLKYNQAMLLAMESAELETRDYLVSRAEEINNRKIELFKKRSEAEEQEPLKKCSETEEQEPQFEFESMTKSERRLYLKELEREEYLENKAQRKAEKAECRRLKKAGKKTEEEQKALPAERPADDEVRGD